MLRSAARSLTPTTRSSAAAEFFALHSRAPATRSTFGTPESLLDAYQTELLSLRPALPPLLYASRSRPSARAGTCSRPWPKRSSGSTTRASCSRSVSSWSRLLDAGFLAHVVTRRSCPPSRTSTPNKIRPHLAEVGAQARLRHHQRRLPLRSRPGTDRSAQRQVPLRGQALVQLGVLPSYTALGMASLLPAQDAGLQRQGRRAGGRQERRRHRARSKHLRACEGMACKANDLRAMKKDEAREFTEGQAGRLHLPQRHRRPRRQRDHRRRDLRGRADGIDELAALVRFIVNNLNAANVVTADHGFLFQHGRARTRPTRAS